MRPFWSRSFRFAAALGGLLFATSAARAQVQWTTPTGDELNMTSEPKAPGAKAIILSYEQTDDADSAEMMLHVRIKVLTDGGLSAGNIELPRRFRYDEAFADKVVARTIHRDGTVVLFKGVPFFSDDPKADEDRAHIAMPAVEAGSILEYFVIQQGLNTTITQLMRYYRPTWVIQQPYFIRQASFTLKVPGELDMEDVRWVANLPSGAAPQKAHKAIALTLRDVPAAPDEEMMPPNDSVLYKVRFFYHHGKTEQYWSETGGDVDEYWSNFDDPRKPLRAAVEQMLGPADTDEQKLHKLYRAVEALENTGYTRQLEAQEQKKLKQADPECADDVWNNKRGTPAELTMLFVAMAKAAGYAAYPMAVTSRTDATFDQNVLSWDQLDSMVAIVNVKGHDVFFDPGVRYTPFAHVAPWHSNVIGVSVEGKLVKIRYTPEENFGGALRERVADLTLAADGTVSGKLQMQWVGDAALTLRQQGLREDQLAVEKTVEKNTQHDAPEGVELKLSSLTGLNDGDAPLLATFSVTGKLGAGSGKRMFVPAEFFEATSSTMFAPETRTQPVNFANAHQDTDLLRLHLPPGFAVEVLPQGQVQHIDGDTAFQTILQQKPGPDGSTVEVKRVFALKRVDYPVADYSRLRTYFGQLSAADHEQIVLARPPAQSASAATP